MTTAQAGHAVAIEDAPAGDVLVAALDFPRLVPSKLTEADHFSIALKLMIASCEAAGFTLSGDLRVGERDAAALLGYSAGYLKTMRQEGRGPVSYLRGIGGCRISYRLFDLVAWVEFRRDDR